MRLERRRRLTAVVSLAAVACAVLGWLRPSASARAQDTGEIWVEPFNLSQSGAASKPAIAAEPTGTLHALWFDQFDGTMYSVLRKELGWSRPVTVPSIVGGRSRTGQPAPPQGLLFLVDTTRVLHAFWLSDAGDLLYARKPPGFAAWSSSLKLATTPLTWDVNLDSRNRLHLAVIKPTQVGTLPAGVYYRESVNNGLSWTSSVLVDESLYFRTLAPERAHVNVVSDGQRNTFVTWDDPQLGESIYARAHVQGIGFEEADVFGGSQAAESAPTRARLIALPTGGLMALWQAGSSCALYQQHFDDAAETWSTAMRVMDALSNCPAAQRTYFTSDGKLLLVMEQPGGSVAFASWDGTTWSEPYTSQISFINPINNRSTTLGCLKITLTGDHVAAVGCDQNGDVWATNSQVPVAALLPALESAWSTPALLSQGSGDAGLPSMTLDTDGQAHVLWSEAGEPGQEGEYLTYARGDGRTWTLSPHILKSPTGKAVQPSITADAGGVLHAAWSGGASGQIYYSQAFIRDATTVTGWSEPLALSTPRPTGAWPSLAADARGGLHLLFAIPLNESRGVYALSSTDQGHTWSEPRQVFDAVQASWAMVGETRMAMDEAGRLHVMWTQTTFTGAPLGVYYSRSEDGGQTWSPAAIVSEAEADHPRILATAADSLHRTWVQKYLGRLEIWHQASRDDGLSWTEPERALDTTFSFTPDMSLAGDGLGSVYLSGIERTVTNSAALYSLRWDGSAWIDHERLALGFDPAEEAGVAMTLLPGGDLGVFYRVRAPSPEGTGHYVVGYTQRAINAAPIVAPATFTPQPANTPVPTVTIAPTLAPSPTPDLTDPVNPAPDNGLLVRIGGVLAVMIVVTVLAVGRLWGTRRQ